MRRLHLMGVSDERRRKQDHFLLAGKDLTTGMQIIGVIRDGILPAWFQVVRLLRAAFEYIKFRIGCGYARIGFIFPHYIQSDFHAIQFLIHSVSPFTRGLLK
jgi:hypothetical protein